MDENQTFAINDGTDGNEMKKFDGTTITGITTEAAAGHCQATNNDDSSINRNNLSKSMTKDSAESGVEESTTETDTSKGSTHVAVDRMNNDEQCTILLQQVLLNLPPLPKQDIEHIVNTLPSTRTDDTFSIENDRSIYNNNNNNNALIEQQKRAIEQFWIEYNVRTCSTYNNQMNTGKVDDKTNHEYISYLQQQIQDYHDSLYKSGDGNHNCHVSAKFAVATEKRNDDNKWGDINDTDAIMLTNTDVIPTTASSKSITSNPSNIVLRTYVESIDSTNFCNGSWASCWCINILDEISATVTGSIQIHTYYYEDVSNEMNSQSQISYPVPLRTVTLKEEKVNSMVAKFERTTLSYAEKLVTKIVQYIIQQEQSYYNDAISNALAEDTVNDQLRSLRRILPISKQKMNWSVLSSSNSNTTSSGTSNIMKQKQTFQQQFMMHKNMNTSKNKNTTTAASPQVMASFAMAAAAAARNKK